MHLWQGACQVHELFSARGLFELIHKHPDAVVIAHPECDESILELADVVGSTSKLLNEVQNNPAKKFIVATENGIFHQMLKIRPEVTLIQAPHIDGSCGCNQCPFMKLNTLEKIKAALISLQPEVQLSQEVIMQAQIPLRRMIAAASGHLVDYPVQFEKTQASVL